jgi:hypothetical protein
MRRVWWDDYDEPTLQWVKLLMPLHNDSIQYRKLAAQYADFPE